MPQLWPAERQRKALGNHAPKVLGPAYACLSSRRAAFGTSQRSDYKKSKRYAEHVEAMDSEDLRHLEQILERVKLGKITLFLGAGASVSAGAPDTETLIQTMKGKFSLTDAQGTDFFSNCQDVVETAPYGRAELEGFIKSQLDSLEPTRAHSSLTRYDWQAIFTTNYDELIELAYRTPDRKRICHPICSADFNENLFDHDKVYLFKLMGTLTGTDQAGRMVLTRSDYNRMLRARPRYIDCLHDVLKDGAVVFIGYSGKDFFVFELIDELKDKYGDESLSSNYFLVPDAKSLSQVEQERLRRRRLLAVSCSFEEFFQYLGSNPIGIIHPPRTGAQIRIGETILQMGADERRNLEGYFEIVTDASLPRSPGDRDDFFRGTNRSWAAFREGWDFIRGAYSTEQTGLKSRVYSELAKTEPEDNRILYVTGMPGAGKSIMIRRLGYDVYESGTAPVVLLDPNRDTFDFKLLYSSLKSLMLQFNAESGRPARRQFKTLILVDDAALLPWDVRYLLELLTSRRIPVLIVATGRDNEWGLSISEALPKKDTYRIEDYLTDEERAMLLQHLNKIGYHTSLEDLIAIAEREEKSFFATMYTLVHPSRKRLEEIIKDQRLSLVGPARRALDLVCVMHQFGISLPTELLIRSLGWSFPDFYNMLERDAKGVLFELEDRNGNMLCVTHHRIIASKTVQFFIEEPELQKNLFLQILSNCEFYNQIEREIVERLMVSCIDAERGMSSLGYEQKQELFSRICADHSTRCLLHHWGILEMSQRNYAKAEELLLRALSLPQTGYDDLREESEQNLLTTLGNCYSHWGMEMLAKGDSMPAERMFKLAGANFERGRMGVPANPHAYHAHAYMYLKRAQDASDTLQKFEYIAKALRITTEASDILSPDFMLPLRVLEMNLYAELGREKEIRGIIDDISRATNSGLGYFLYASVVRRRALAQTDFEKDTLLRRAFDETSRGLNKYPDDMSCLALKAKLYGELSGADLEAYFEHLKEWHDRVSDPRNITLLYELGRVAFELELYQESNRAFRELDRASRGHSRRFQVKDLLLDSKKEKRVFEGAVVGIKDSQNGELTCHSLRKLTGNLRFAPASCEFTPAVENLVTFNIGFDLLGPRALNVRKIG
jgi:tetratricopeptide (TPR) repeat protein